MHQIFLVTGNWKLETSLLETIMNDIRTQLLECPLAYEVPHIPGDHTPLVISITAAAIDWQAKMLPWTLASLINNTDLIMQGVHLYIACEDGTEDRIRSALSLFDLPDGTIFRGTDPSDAFTRSFKTAPIVDMDVNYWAFRDASNTHKLDLNATGLQNYTGSQIIKPYPPISEASPAPALYDMTHCTIEQFRHAMKQLMGAQLAISV